MSQTIDQKVVEIRFDNKQFEAAVSTTLSSLDKLRSSLKFDQLGSNVDAIAGSIKNVNFNGISEGIDKLVDRSSISARAIDAIISRTINGAINGISRMGGYISNLANEFTIAPIRSGFQEYETQINAVQTILANTSNKGTTIDQVNNALGELNTYADKTIYNFTEMTRNIGTFTAAGVDLDTSVSAIQGIANVAAVSGSTSQQASTAMYQLSQALAAGSVKLQDWNSVVNAGMGGEVFQNALKETAREHGIAVDQMIADEGSFRESLKHGWISADLLTETLSKFTETGAAEYVAKMTGLTKDEVEATIKEKESIEEASKALAEKSGRNQKEIQDVLQMAQTATDAATKVKTFTQLMDTLKEAAQSGWTQTWQYFLGDFEEAKEMFTYFSDTFGNIIGKSADNRNNMLKLAMTDLSAWNKAVEDYGIPNSERFLKTFEKVVRDSGVNVDELKEKFGSFEKAFSAKDRDWLNTDQLKNSIHAYTEELSGMTDEQLKAAGITKDQVEQLKRLDDRVQNGKVSLEEFMQVMSQKSGRWYFVQSLKNVTDAVVKLGSTVMKAFRDIVPPTTAGQFYSLMQAIESFTRGLIMSDQTAENLRKTLRSVFMVIDIGLHVVGAITKAVLGLAGIIFKVGTKILAIMLGITGPLSGFVTSLYMAIKSGKVLEFFFDTLEAGVNKLVTGIQNAWKAITGFFNYIKGIDNWWDFLFGGSTFDPNGKATTAPKTLADWLITWKENLQAKMKDFLGMDKYFSELQGKFSNYMASAQSFTRRCWEIISTGFKPIYDEVVDKYGWVFERIKELFDQIVKPIKDLFSGLNQNIIEDLEKNGFQIKGTIEKLKTNIASAKTSFKEVISTWKADISDYLRNNEIVTSLITQSKRVAKAAGELFGTIGEEVYNTLGTAYQKVVEVLAKFFGDLTEKFNSVKDAIKEFREAHDLTSAGKVITAAGNVIVGVLEKLKNGFSTAASWIREQLGHLSENLTLENLLETLKKIIGLLAGAFVGKVGFDFGKWIWNIGQEINKFLDLFRSDKHGSSAFSSFVDSISDGLSKFTQKVQPAPIREVALAIGMLAAALWVLSTIDPQSLVTALGGLTAVVLEMTGALLLLIKFGGSKNAKSIEAMQRMITSVSVCLLVMSGAFKILSDLDWDQIRRGVVAMGTIILLLIGTLRSLEKVQRQGSTLTKFSGQLIAFSVALRFIASAMKRIAMLDGVKLLVAIPGMIACLAAIVTMAEYSKGITKQDLSKLTIIVSSFKSMSIGFIGMAAAMKLMGSLSWGGFLKAMIAITAIMGSMRYLIDNSNYLNPKSIKKVASAIETISKSLITIAFACKLFEFVNVEGMVKAGASLVAVGGILMIVDHFQTDLSNIDKFGKAVYKLSEAAISLAIASKLFEFVNWEGMIKAGTGLAAVSAILLAVDHFQTDLSNIDKFGKAVRKLSQAAISLALASKLFEFVRLDGMIKALSSTGVMMVELAVVTNLFDTSDFEQMDKKFKAMSKAMISIGSAMVIVGIAAKAFEGVSWKALSTGLAAMVGMIATIKVLSMIGGDTKSVSTLAGSMVMLGFALLALTPPLLILSQMSWEGIIKGLVGLGGSLLILVGAAYALAPISGVLMTMSGSMALFGLGCAAVGAGVALLAVGFLALSAAILAGGTMIVAFLAEIIVVAAKLLPLVTYYVGKAVLSFIEGLAAGFNEAKPAISTLIDNVIQMFVEKAPNISEGFMKVLDETCKSLANHGASIADSLIDLFTKALQAVAARMPELTEAVAKVIIAFFDEIGKAIKSVDTDQFVNMLVGFGAISALVAWFSFIAGMIPSAMLGVLGVGALLLEISAVIWTLGKINEMLNMSDGIAKGAELLRQIGDAIGGFVGSLIGSIGETASSYLPAIAENLNAFWNGLKPFLDGVGSVDAGVYDSINSLCGALLALTATNLLNQLVSFFGGNTDLGSISSSMVTLGIALVAFSASIQTLDAAAVEKIKMASEAVHSLVEVANSIPPQGGLAQKILGTKDLTDFATGMTTFGPALAQYSDSISKITEDDIAKIKKSAEGAKAIVEVAQAVPNSGGILADLVGDNTLSQFAFQLVPFGVALTAYSKVVKDLDNAAVEKSKTAADVMVALSKEIPNSGGLLGWIMGNNDLDDFGTKLASFGEKLVDYSNKVAELKYTSFDNSINCINAIVEIANTLEEIKISNLSTIKEMLPSLGANLNSLVTNLEGTVTDPTVFATVTVAVESIASMLDTLATKDTSGILNFSEALKELAEINIGAFVDSFNSAEASGRIQSCGTTLAQGFKTGLDQGFASVNVDFSGVINDAITAAMVLIAVAITQLYDQGMKMSQGLYNGIKNGLPADNILNRYVTAMVTDLRGRVQAFYNVGVSYAQGFANGIRNSTGTIGNMFNYPLECLIANVRGYGSRMQNEGYSIGSWFCRGLANGMNAYAWTVRASAANLGNIMSNATKNATQTHSPSRVAIWIGRMFDQGLVVGMKAGAKAIRDTATENAEDMSSAFKNAMNRAKELVDYSVDDMPTIRPVMDLSDISTGVDTINSMFARSQALNVSADFENSAAGNFGKQFRFGINESNTKLSDKIDQFVDILNNRTMPVEIHSHNHLYMNSKEMAHSITPAIKEEMNSIDLFNMKLRGITR